MEHIDHILVVDDDRDIRELIIDYLVKSGYRASGAANGKEMRVVLDKQHIDLVVLDVMMPGDDGLTLCRQLRIGFSGRSCRRAALVSLRGTDSGRHFQHQYCRTLGHCHRSLAGRLW